MAITMNGVWKKLCLQVIHDFLGSEKVGEESKEVFSNSVSLSEKLQSASATAARGRLRWTPCCAHKELTDEDLMELEAQRKDEETAGRRSDWRTEEIPDAGNGRGISLPEEVLLVFEALDLNSEQYTKAATAIQSANQCYRVVYDKDRKSCYPGIIESFLPKVR